MRIVSGKYKGRHFSPGKKFKARPTTDFAKENLFNILHNRVNFEDLKVLDLFSGTGSISFEFLSRGCTHLTLVEKEFQHYSFIKKCLADLKPEGIIIPIRGDVFKYIKNSGQKYDLVFLDPPYNLEALDTLPDLIFKHQLLTEEGILVLEHGKDYDFSDHPQFAVQKKYGSVHFSIFGHYE